MLFLFQQYVMVRITRDLIHKQEPFDGDKYSFIIQKPISNLALYWWLNISRLKIKTSSFSWSNPLVQKANQESAVHDFPIFSHWIFPTSSHFKDQVLKPGRQLPYLSQAQMPDEQRAVSGRIMQRWCCILVQGKPTAMANGPRSRQLARIVSNYRFMMDFLGGIEQYFCKGWRSWSNTFQERSTNQCRHLIDLTIYLL